MAKSVKKQPRTTLRSSTIDRQPKTLSRSTDDHGQSRPLFSFHHADDKGSSPCAFAPQPEEAKGLIESICEMSKLTWREIRAQTADGRKRHHSQPVDKISPEARARLAARHLDEIVPDGADAERAHNRYFGLAVRGLASRRGVGRAHRGVAGQVCRWFARSSTTSFDGVAPPKL